MFPVQFLTAEDLVETVQTVVPNGRVAFLEEENQLIVAGSQTDLDTVAGLLEEIDVARQQVRITALLYDVDLEVMEQFGFNWAHAAKGSLNANGDPNKLFALSSENFPAAASTNPLPQSPILADTAATAFARGSLGGLATLTNLSRHFDMRAVIRALDTTDGSRLLARPNIVAYE
jgi:general secretion pathway protein D